MEIDMRTILLATALALASSFAYANCGVDDTACDPSKPVSAPQQASITPEKPAEHHPAGRYGAVAAAIWNDGNNWHVMTNSFAPASTPGAAAANAIQRCSQSSGGVRCRVVWRFNGGCAYYTTASDEENVRWCVGASVNAALARCSGMSNVNAVTTVCAR
jgi:hypothetical protein